MPQINSETLNLADGENSTTTALGAFATFAGEWVAMTNYTSCTVMVAGDQILSARFEWSDDGVTPRESQPILMNDNPLSYGGAVVAHSTMHGLYRRVVVENGGTAQTPGLFVVQAVLRRGAANGYISPLVTFPTDADAAQSVKAVLYGRRPPNLGDPIYTHVLTDGAGNLISVPPLNTDGMVEQSIPASLVSSQLDFFGLFGDVRRGMTVLNDTAQGTLHINLGSAASLLDFHYKVRPQELWTAPTDWVRWGGEVHGIWDVDDGTARVTEIL